MEVSFVKKVIGAPPMVLRVTNNSDYHTPRIGEAVRIQHTTYRVGDLLYDLDTMRIYVYLD